MTNRNGFLCVKNLNKVRRLVLPWSIHAVGKNFLEIASAEVHTATTHYGIYKTMKPQNEKFKYHSFSHLVREYIRGCDICQRINYLQRGPIRYVTRLHVPLRL